MGYCRQCISTVKVTEKEDSNLYWFEKEGLNVSEYSSVIGRLTTILSSAKSNKYEPTNPLIETAYERVQEEAE